MIISFAKLISNLIEHYKQYKVNDYTIYSNQRRN